MSNTTHDFPVTGDNGARDFNARDIAVVVVSYASGSTLEACLFRLAAIVHGIKGRLVRGNASSAHAAQMVERLEPLAELAWSEAERARL